MICPKCKTEGKKSTISIGHSMVTCAYYQPYYDEEGAYHYHDSNVRSTVYNCSNGHTMTVRDQKLCPNCDFGKNFQIVDCFDNEASKTTLIVDGTGVIQIKNSNE